MEKPISEMTSRELDAAVAAWDAARAAAWMAAWAAQADIIRCYLLSDEEDRNA